MKSLKKTLVLLVVFSMILSTLVPAFAATDVDGLDCEDQVTRMEALGIIKGFEDGTFRPTETITRAQMAVIICKMTGVTDAIADANKNVDSKFSDVKAGEWYTGYVNIASNNGIITGFPDGTFRPNETLTLNQVLTLCVKALGRGGYVDKMGTWPANYIAEAARLNLLKDVKGASDANRGNVAVICWNTLNTNTWYVSSEKLDGEVTLGVGEETKTLLAINFADFTTTNDTFKEIEDIEITKANINDRQLKFTAVEDRSGDFVFADFEDVDTIKSFDFAKEPSKDKDEKSYKDGNTIYVYVPEEVCEDLDSLRNKTITLILGEDNVAALILVQDDVVETAFLTKYDADAHKITIDGTTYKIRMDDSDEDLEVTLNDNETEYATLEEALTALKVDDDDFKKIEKAIEATVTLDEDDKVEAIDMLVSAELTDVSTEVLVTKVKETSSKYTIYTTGKNITWDVDDEDDLDFPKVYVDGNKADIRDIEAGNVLTVLFDEDASDIQYNDTYDIAKIYASTKVVTGEATKVKKSNNAITLDGEVYMATSSSVKMSTDELKDNKFTLDFDADDILDNDEVTLYLNMFGEYVAVALDETDTDYTFGVVTFVSSNITWEGDDEEIAVRNIKVLLPDGKKTTYKITVDTDDDDIPDGAKEAVQAEDFKMCRPGDFVMFEADADKKIAIESEGDLIVLSGLGRTDEPVDPMDAEKIGTTDYILTSWETDSVDKDDEEFTATYTDEDDVSQTISAEYDSSTTVIFNTAEKEIVSKWKSILAKDDKNFAAKTFAIFEDEDEDIPLYIVVNIAEDDYSSSDVTYAVVDNSAYQTKDTYYVDFVGEENVEIKDGVVENLKKINGWLVEYAMSSSKISSAFKLIDVEEIQGKDTKDTTTLAELIDVTTDSDKETTLVTSGAYKFEQIELDEVKISSSGKITLKFVETGDNDVAIDDVKLDKDEITVYDLRDGGFTEIDIEDVQTEVADGESVYVIPAYNADADYTNDGANLLFIVK